MKINKTRASFRSEFQTKLFNKGLIFIGLFIMNISSNAIAGWEVQWIDRFDGEGINWSNWTAQIQANYNNEVQCYTDDESSSNKNFEVSNSTLKIIDKLSWSWWSSKVLDIRKIK